jgi:hypothetical protein
MVAAAKLRPVAPGRDGPDVSAWRQSGSAHYIVALDEKTGEIRRLWAKKTEREWASTDHPLALFSYQTFSADDYARFMDSYVTSKADWAPQDFGKPNIDHFGAKSRMWTPTVMNSWSGETAEGVRLLARLRIEDPAAEKSGLVAWPKTMYLDLLFPTKEPLIKVAFSCFDKVANRLPDAMWLSFHSDATLAQGSTM